jgi:EAL domain-containing protein (putative c-di-GMP-specific phosphodiesterase class I)
LKIDRSFIKDIDQDSTHEAVIHAVAGLGRRLGMKVVAEGVETQAQYEIMCAHSIDEIQGFYFSKPQMPNAIEQMMNEFEGYTEKLVG